MRGTYDLMEGDAEPCQDAGIDGRLIPQVSFPAQQRDPYRIPLASQMPSGAESVTAVIAGSTVDQDWMPAAIEHVLDGARQRGAGAIHEQQARDPHASNRRLVDPAYRLG